MEKEFWLNTWETNNIGFHKDAVNPNLIEFIDTLKLKPGDIIFVPLCGKSLDMLWLSQQGFKVIGVELSSIACVDFFQENNLTYTISSQTNFTVYTSDNIKLFCGDFFKITCAEIGGIQAIYDRAALYALPKEMRQAYVDHLLLLSDKDTRILLLAFEATPNDSEFPPFPVTQAEIIKLFNKRFCVKQLKNQPLLELPPLYQQKGYTQVAHSVYLLSHNL